MLTVAEWRWSVIRDLASISKRRYRVFGMFSSGWQMFGAASILSIANVREFLKQLF
jgi:hypothetical protein